MATKKKEVTTSKVTAEEKLAKKKARLEAIKNRPAGQRPNSKQIDVIESGETTVENWGYSVRKMGTIVTSIVKDKDGNVISTSVTFIPGTKVKAKKGHGTVVPGVAGEGKKGKKGEDEEEVEEVKDKKKKSKKNND